jgi:hypothetical protein
MRLPVRASAEILMLRSWPSFFLTVLLPHKSFFLTILSAADGGSKLLGCTIVHSVARAGSGILIDTRSA